MSQKVIRDFNRILEVQVADFFTSTEAFNSDPMRIMASLVMRAFETEYVLICQGVARQRPADDEELRRITEPTYALLRSIQEFRDSHRHVEAYANHMATIAESVAALSWITFPNTPLQFVRDMKEAGDYYGNRVLISYRGNELHTTWINRWNEVLTALEEYVKEHHRTGFAWDSLRRSNVPAPPPPPPPSYFGGGDACNAPVEGDPALERDRGTVSRSALLQSISQGPRIMNILKPTDRTVRPPVSPPRSPPSRASAVCPIAQSTGARFAQRSADSSPSHPPVFVLEGKKWRIEYQTKSGPLEITPNDKSESLALYKCDNIMLETKGKMNAVTIDSCKKTQIVLQHIISSVELIRCERCEVHCMGTCPNITLDNCDSVSIFLCDSSLNCEIITAKCTSTNVCRVSNDGDCIEYPVPEQIRSVIGNNKLNSTVVEHM